MEHGGARSYLNPLNDYESLTQEAIALARSEGSSASISQHTPRDLDLERELEAHAIRAVMLRWPMSAQKFSRRPSATISRPPSRTTRDFGVRSL